MGTQGRGNYAWCLVIVVISMGLGRTEVGEEILESPYGVAIYKGGQIIFMGLVDPYRHNVGKNNPNFTQLFEKKIKCFLKIRNKINLYPSLSGV